MTRTGGSFFLVALGLAAGAGWAEPAAALPAAGKYSLGVPVSVEVPNGTISLGAGDLNGDGKADLVVGGSTVGRPIVAYLNKGDGSFGPAIKSEAPGEVWHQRMDLGDLDGDGKLDAFGGGGMNPVFCPGMGDGSFGLPVKVKILANYLEPSTYSQVLADFDGDGSLDVAISGYEGFGVGLNNGKGDFKGFANFNSRGEYGNAISTLAAADFDGDGDQDLAAGDAFKKAVRIFLNDGDAGFEVAAAKAYPLPSAVAAREDPAELTMAGDFNGDGKPDLAVTSYQSVDVLLNKGDGSFGPARSYPISSATVWSGAAIDLDQDGRAELAFACSGHVSLLKNQGDGTFAPAKEHPVTGQTAAIKTADFNGNGVHGVATVSVEGSRPATVDVFFGKFKAPPAPKAP